MKDVLTLAAEKRESVGTRSSRRERAEGRVPAIIYGHKQDPQPVTVAHDALQAALRHHGRMLDLKLGRSTERVLLSDVQYDTYGTEVIHADFIRVAMDELVRVDVPVVLHGHAAGEQHGGVTEQLLTEVSVVCLPGDIPEEIRVVITALELGQSLHVGDLSAPQGVKIVADPSHLVLTIAAPTKAVEPEAEVATEAVAGEPELIARGAEEPEDGEAKGKDEGAKG